jgi:hypothetical protein
MNLMNKKPKSWLAALTLVRQRPGAAGVCLGQAARTQR